jgi:hypothetical protein
VAAIVDRVYPDLTPERRTAAAETVVAHLDKLREEERRRRDRRPGYLIR